MKLDIYNHEKLYKNWKAQLTPKYIEADITKENSKLFTSYILDMEQGINLPKHSVKGARSLSTLNRVRSKMKGIIVNLQKAGIKDISKIKEKELIDFFSEWNKTHSIDYVKRFKAFWNWWMTKNRRQGKIITDITEQLDTRTKRESTFVWLTKEQFDKLRSFFTEDEQVMLMFCFDTIIRAPTELASLKVEDIYEKGKDVWVDIPNEISKTFGRKFNLLYSGEQVLKYIKRNQKKPNDFLFSFSPSMINKRLQKIAKQLWGNKKSEGGEYFKNITLYDLRHSGAIHFRQLFQKTGQSLDVLRERGGWTDFKMINYYTKRLGLDGHIQREKIMLEEEKSELEKRITKLEKFIKYLSQNEDLSPEEIENISLQIKPNS